MNADTIILLRTHEYDDQFGRYARQLRQQTGYPVCLAMDETQGKIEVPDDLLKLSLNDDAVSSLRLLRPTRYSWRCGDYPFYLARQRFPLARWFWQIESDVKINFADSSTFFGRYAVYPDLDFLAAHLVEADPRWGWRRAMEPFAAKVMRCFFPAVRLSAPAIDQLLCRRQELSLHFSEGVAPGMWPNDESFVATELADGNWRCADLNFKETVYSLDSFEYYRAYSRSMFLAADDRLYHSVRYGNSFIARLKLCLHAATASWTSQDEKQRIIAMLRRGSLAPEIARETSASEAIGLMATVDRVIAPNKIEVGHNCSVD